MTPIEQRIREAAERIMREYNRRLVEDFISMPPSWLQNEIEQTMLAIRREALEELAHADAVIWHMSPDSFNPSHTRAQLEPWRKEACERHKSRLAPSRAEGGAP